jgi:hypothetical protein
MVHWDAKASRYIERAPYVTYCQYEAAGEPVLLFICPEFCEDPPRRRQIFVGRLCNVHLKHGRQTVDQYPQSYPVSRDGWVAPRDDLRGPLNGSGTDYREIDIRRSGMLYVGTAQWNANGPDVTAEPVMFTADTARRSEFSEAAVVETLAQMRGNPMRRSLIRLYRGTVNRYAPHLVPLVDAEIAG